MKNIASIIIASAALAGPVLAQEVPDELPKGAVMPSNLSDLGGRMRDRVGEIVAGEDDTEENTVADSNLSLFAGDADDDRNLVEIRRLARELESQRALMGQVADLQDDLIDFARKDPAAAYRSRIPTSVCEYAFEGGVCAAMNASFQDRTVIIRGD